MKRVLILIIGILFLISCKEQVAKFLFDASKMSNQTKFFYKYDSEKLISQTEKYYTIMFGQVVDSMITYTDFKYNNKGLLFQEISKTGFQDKPTIEIYDYDGKDSLVSKISINPENDTTFWEEYKYYPDGKKTVFRRLLLMNFDPNQDYMEYMEVSKLDTSLFRNEFDYYGDLCKTQRQLNATGDLVRTINFDYSGTQLIKETHLTYFDDRAMKDKIKYYDYSKSEIKPDFYSLDFKNDTVEFCVNEFSNGFLVTSTESYGYGQNIHKTFFENEKEIGFISIDLNMNIKVVHSYEYYENGNVKKINSYIEDINNAH